jgi:predicted Zn-dependent peptidase
MHTDHGYIGISAGVDTTRVDLGLKTIIEETEKLKEELVSDEELQRAKDSITNGMLLGLETSDARADFAAHDETLRHELRKPEEIMKDIQKVTATEIRDVARKYFVNKKLNMAIIGPYKDEGKFKILIAWTIENYASVSHLELSSSRYSG